MAGFNRDDVRRDFRAAYRLELDTLRRAVLDSPDFIREMVADTLFPFDRVCPECFGDQPDYPQTCQCWNDE